MKLQLYTNVQKSLSWILVNYMTKVKMTQPSAECQSELCQDKKCVTLKDGSECKSDNQCGNDSYCKYNSSTKKNLC